MGKGDLKRLKLRFKKGNNLSPCTGGFRSSTGKLKYVRLNKTMTDLVKNNPDLASTNSSTGNLSQEPFQYRLLRSHSDDDTKSQFMSGSANEQR